MNKQHKDILAAIIRDVRHELMGMTAKDGTPIRGDLDRELERLGVLLDGRVQPIDALPNASEQERQAHYAAEQYIDAAVRQGRSAAAARSEYVEQAGYSWINRLVALRALEARRLIPGTLRPVADYGGISEALYLLAETDPARAAAPDAGWWAVLDAACAAQAEALPGLFGAGDPVLTLRPGLAALRRIVERIGAGPASATVEDTDQAFGDPDAIGWAYQFYQEEAKAAAFAGFKAGKKADSRATIAAATQLFTEPYMVKWLLQNSLGRSYHEIHPNSTLPETWEYYIRPGDQQPLQPPAPTAATLDMLTVLDPCVGSGHFLREAFDLLVAMYREQHPDWDARQIADTILRRHLHGIDIDPRAVQLAALTLYMRALELLRDEARARRRPPPNWIPQHINLATTPGINLGPTPVPASRRDIASDANSKLKTQNLTLLDRHLARHPEDRPLRAVLERIFATLAQADILGSLLRPGDEIDAAIEAALTPQQATMFDGADQPATGPHSQAGQRVAAIVQSGDRAELKRMVLDRIATAFRAEAASADPADALFGREAERGIRLLQLLDRKYAVVVTNPPYMGSKNMPEVLKKYVEKHYKAGKRDLYAAFILRCLDLSLASGRVAMVTQQSWIFTRSYADLRALPDDKLVGADKKSEFTGLLRQSMIEALAHLGPNAFEEISGEIVQVALLTLSNKIPTTSHIMRSFRLVGIKSVPEKMTYLLNSSHLASAQLAQLPKQSDFLEIPETPITYYLDSELMSLLMKGRKLHAIAEVRTGLQTSDNERFTRCFWESATPSERWYPYAKGGGYSKWAGLDWLCIDWQHNGGRLKAFPPSVLRAQEFYFCKGLTYSPVSGGALGMRYMEGSLFDVKGASLFQITDYNRIMGLAACLSSHVCSFLTRAISRSLELHVGYLSLVPVPNGFEKLENVGVLAESLKRWTVSSKTFERGFINVLFEDITYRISAILHTTEGFNEQYVFNAYGLTSKAIQAIGEETGTPAGFHPLVAGYDALPELPADLELPALPREVVEYLEQHERINPSPAELARIKARLRALYEAGPGAKLDAADDDTDGADSDDEDEGAVAGAHIPIPTETFLEELSVKMELHPISVYWLLEELRAEGARCKPEERRLLEDRLTVLTLRLLGHRWPSEFSVDGSENSAASQSEMQNRQQFTLEQQNSKLKTQNLELPPWVDRDGIIPLVTLGTGESTLAERLRERLRDEDGLLGAQQTEALLSELTGSGSLDEWLARQFWQRHMRQFKSRPVAWHLASRPVAGGAGAKKGKTKGGRREPLFQCMLYYHATGGDALARLRTQYVEPLLRREETALNEALARENSEAAASANLRVQELREFLANLQHVEREGFACPELDALLANEPLDRWSGDGIAAPATRDDLVRHERGWHVDLNDGVRVNIAPLQLAGLLQSDVLKPADAKKALADRARWRSDERRWVREGKLPRCGWMPDSVPESPEWTRKAPERAAEQRKLEEKRRAIQAHTAPEESI